MRGARVDPATRSDSQLNRCVLVKQSRYQAKVFLGRILRHHKLRYILTPLVVNNFHIIKLYGELIVLTSYLVNRSNHMSN
jgi:hypothetical protein